MRSIPLKLAYPMHTSSTKPFIVRLNNSFRNYKLCELSFFLFHAVARRKTIYEYHRVNFNGQDISNDTVIYLKALPTCLEHTDCVSCLDAKLEAFNVSCLALFAWLFKGKNMMIKVEKYHAKHLSVRGVQA